MRGDLMISEKRDQTYRLKAIVRKDGPIQVSKLEQILDDAKKQGIFHNLLKSYGLLDQFSY